MTEDQSSAKPIDEDVTPEGVDGTREGNPIAGVEISEEEVERAVEPDEDALEVDGPQQSHP